MSSANSAWTRARACSIGSRGPGSAVRAEQVRRGEARAALARVPPPVLRPDADRPARRRHREHLAAARVRRPGSSLLLLTVFNALLGLQQEGKAAAAVAALQKMMIIKAQVRRDGQLVESRRNSSCQATSSSIEAGDIVPADGRMLAGGHARGRRVGADGREPAGLEVGGHDRGRGRAARRPHRHGLHEHQRDARHGALRRHLDRDGDRGRPHLEHAPAPGRDGHASRRASCRS